MIFICFFFSLSPSSKQAKRPDYLPVPSSKMEGKDNSNNKLSVQDNVEQCWIEEVVEEELHCGEALTTEKGLVHTHTPEKHVETSAKGTTKWKHQSE